jgi:hypothetical protein
MIPTVGDRGMSIAVVPRSTLQDPIRGDNAVPAAVMMNVLFTLFSLPANSLQVGSAQPTGIANSASRYQRVLGIIVYLTNGMTAQEQPL